MRILHLDTGMGWRGGQQQVLWLMEGLRKRGYQQALAALPDSPLAATMRGRGFEIADLKSPAKSLANVGALRRVAGEFDILHAHDARAHTLAWLAGTARGDRAWPVLIVSRRVAFPIARFGRFKYAAADAYIAVSEYVRQRLIYANVPAAKVHVVFDGVEPEPLPGERSEFRGRFGLSEDTPLIGTLTSLAPEKLVKEEVELLSALPPSVHLWIGRSAAEPEGAAEQVLLVHAKERGVEKRFRVLPLSGDIGGFLRSLDVFVYLSRAEGLGSAILLAMAHGLPVVASRVGGIPEIVHHNETGLLIGDRSWQQELQAAVRLLLDAAPLRRELAMAGRKFVMENATTALMVSKTAAVYEQVFHTSGQESKRQRPGAEASTAQLPSVLGGKA